MLVFACMSTHKFKAKHKKQHGNKLVIHFPTIEKCLSYNSSVWKSSYHGIFIKFLFRPFETLYLELFWFSFRIKSDTTLIPQLIIGMS